MTDAQPRTEPSSTDAGGASGGGLEMRQLVREHYSSVYRYAYRLSGTAADAEDLTQQTFLIAQQKLHQVRDVEKVDRWLFAVLRSVFCKSRRKSQREAARRGEVDVSQIPDLSATANDDVDQELLQAALADLPDNFRLVLVMFYFDQLSYKEIAAELDISIGTVMSRLNRAKGRMRGWLLGSHERSGREETRPATSLYNASSSTASSYKASSYKGKQP